MPRPEIYFNEHEINLLIDRTGLSKLELTGIIAEMNKFTYNAKDLARWNHDEAMGRHIY